MRRHEIREVTVVVPHFGDPTPTLRTVEDLRGQRHDAPLQIVVVDDASPVPFPDTDGVEVVRRSRNGGFGSAVNSGAAVARHPMLLVLNSDVEVGPTFVADLVAEADPWMPAVAGPLVVDHVGVPAWSGRHFPTVGHQTVEWLTPLARFRDRQALHEAVGHDTRAVPGAVVPVDWVVGAALLLPTEVFRAVGGFDEGFFMNSEEVDLQRRLRERGIPSVFVGTVSLLHVGGASSDPHARRRWLVESRLRYADRWGGRRRLRAALTVATAVNLVANGARLASGRAVRPMATAREELDLIHGGGRTRAAARGAST